MNDTIDLPHALSREFDRYVEAVAQVQHRWKIPDEQMIAAIHSEGYVDLYDAYTDMIADERP